MKIKLTVFFVFFPILSFSQVMIKGTVQDSLKRPLVRAQILIHDSTQKVLMNYAITSNQGYYQMKISRYHGLVFLTAQSMGFIKKKEHFYIPKIKEIIIKNFSLQEKQTLLKEVVIKANAYPMEVKKDTVTYNVSKFANGSEEVVEDVLKELPGITVNENGDISYQGKPIDKVLVEGANLLGKNYKVLTKNLGANTIKKVQAIEHYIEDKNLKGIEKSNKTVLNLELKNNVKAKPYGDMKLAYGNNRFYNVSVNALGVNKKIKYYLLGTSNNVGINSAPNDYISLTTNTDEIQGPPFLTLVGYEFPDLKTTRVNFNHLYFGSSNLLVNVNKRLKIRNNLYFTKDKNLFDKVNKTKYLLNTGDFTIDEIQSLIRKPLVGQWFFDAQYALTKHSDLDYKIKYRIAQTRYSGIQNTIESFFNESLQNKEQYVYQNINYTNRVNKQNALLVNAQYSYNRKAQDYDLMPFPDSLPFNSTFYSNDTSDLLQHSTIAEHLFKVGAKYLGTKGAINYKLKIGYECRQQSLNSNLFNVKDKSIYQLYSPYEDYGRLGLQDLDVSFQNKYEWKRWKLLYEIPLHYKTFSYQDSTSSLKQSHALVFSPLLGAVFKSKRTKFSLIYSSISQYPEINDLHSGYLLTDYRTLKSGIYRGDIIRTQAVFANFVYQDFGRQLMFYWLLTYMKQNKTFGSKILVSKCFTVMKNAIVPGNKNLIFSSELDKFLPFMYSTVKLGAQVSTMQYFNFVNQSDERNNNVFSGAYNLTLNSGWKKIFNFYAGVKYKFYRVSIENSSFISKTKNLSAHLDFIMNLSKRLKVIIQNEQLFYDIRTPDTKDYYFLDAKIKYTVDPNKISIQLTGNNLLGKTTFDRMSISDYMISTAQYNLVPRQILLNVKFRF